MRMLTVLLCSIMTGCAGLPDVPTEVLIPVSTPCIAAQDMPAIPAFITDADLLKLPDGDFVIALGLDRQERIGYMALVDAILQACVK